MLSVMLSVVDDYPDYQFVIAGAPSQDTSFYASFISNERVKFITGDTYNLLNNSHAAIVTSGTATLETALFKVPQVVCYKSSAISYHIAKRIIKVKYISLVNLIEDKKIVTELIQNDLTKENLIEELTPLLEGAQRQKMLKEYESLIIHCGGVGASKQTANLMLAHLRNI
jgi:lipid-A-disaccharide synthase